MVRTLKVQQALVSVESSAVGENKKKMELNLKEKYEHPLVDRYVCKNTLPENIPDTVS